MHNGIANLSKRPQPQVEAFFMRRVREIIFTSLIFFALVSAPFAWTQQSTGAINGTVRDASGSVIAGAEVSLTNVNTGVIRSLQTNKDGIYVIPQIQPG